jgi:hypothetical protein
VRAPRKTHRYRHSGKVRPGPCSPQCFLLNLYRFEADSSVVSTPTSGEARTISYVCQRRRKTLPKGGAKVGHSACRALCRALDERFC